MGGFGHRSYVEAILGGVTRRMLTKSPIPVLLAH
jgi:nucleotide-binding universal stress UspA family protein